MILPISGLIHIFGFFVTFFLSYKFLKIGKEEDNRVAKFFGYSMLLLSLGRIFLGIPALFFLQDYHTWIIFELIERTFLVSTLSVLGYIVYLIKFPKHIKIIVFFLVLISLIIVVGFAISPPVYHVTEQGFLRWKNPPLIPSLLNFLFLLGVTIPAIIMFFREAGSAKVKKTKITSISMALMLILFLIPAFIDFFSEPFSNILKPIFSDISYFLAYFLILVMIFASYIFELRSRKNPIPYKNPPKKF
jgi:hypothetical protein